MAKLIFTYAAMNSGKSMDLIRTAFNYRESGLYPLIMTYAGDTRYGSGVIESRAGLSEKVHFTFDNKTDIKDLIKYSKFDILLIDEAQFLTKQQVRDLADIADYIAPVKCYGLRTDFEGNLFEGSQYLLGYADTLEEFKTMCSCGGVARFNLRIVESSEQELIGGNESYKPACRKCFNHLRNLQNEKIKSNV